LLLNNNDIM